MPGFKSIRTACQLILRDEARHIQFGRIIMRRFFTDLKPAQEKRLLGEKVAKKLRGSLLNGVYAVVNLPDDERRTRRPQSRAGRGTQGSAPRTRTRRWTSSRRALVQIREDVAPYGVEIPADARGRPTTDGDALKPPEPTLMSFRRNILPRPCCWPPSLDGRRPAQAQAYPTPSR